MHIISLGAGVQSSTMALMAAAGEITPMPDCAIFADTQAEPASVYKWLDWLETQLPFPVYRVSGGNLETASLRVYTNKKTGKTSLKCIIPLFVKSVIETAQMMLIWGDDLFGSPFGLRTKMGMLGRKCTGDYKIVPITRKVRQLLGIYKKRSPLETVAVQWIGISTDEAHRMKPSQEAWVDMRWPLIEMGMSREACLKWMADHNFPTPPRSACYFCPFHSDDEWMRMKSDEPMEFQRAITFEQELQKAQARQETLKGVPYLHRSGVPLDSVVFNSKNGKLRFGNECEGVCGV